MKTRVYYADTDAAGVAYYANYLRWFEIARWELVESLGTSVAQCAKQGWVFAVARVEVDYHAPAILGQEIQIDAAVETVRRVRFTVAQRVVRCDDGTALATAKVVLACVDAQRRLKALPPDLARALRAVQTRDARHPAN